MSLLHEMLDAQARIAELETEVERVTKNFECYERSLTDIREALGLSAEDDHECVLDEIKRLRRERDGALAKLRRYDSGEEMPEALRPENIHPSDDVVAASSRMRTLILAAARGEDPAADIRRAALLEAVDILRANYGVRGEVLDELRRLAARDPAQ